MRRLFKCMLLLLLVASPVAVNAQDQRQRDVDAILRTSEKMIANPAFLQGDAWPAFKATIRSDPIQALPDRQFATAFNATAKALPFTHYRLSLVDTKIDADREANQPPPVALSRLADDAVLLRIDRFSIPVSAISSPLRGLRNRDDRYLVIDLRGNTGGSFPSAVTLARFLTNESIDAGIYLTRTWFDRHGGYPNSAQITSIPVLDTPDLGSFRKLLAREGAVRMLIAPHREPVFGGKVLLLADQHTASTCEPLLYLLQASGRALVVGERTAGAMLSGQRVPIGQRLSLFLPVADFMFADGRRLDGSGVSPDVASTSADALQAALDWIAVDRTRNNPVAQ